MRVLDHKLMSVLKLSKDEFTKAVVDGIEYACDLRRDANRIDEVLEFIKDKDAKLAFVMGYYFGFISGLHDGINGEDTAKSLLDAIYFTHGACDRKAFRRFWEHVVSKLLTEEANDYEQAEDRVEVS